jgi:hypothetical protein
VGEEVEKLSTLDDESGEKALNNGGSEDENKKEKARTVMTGKKRRSCAKNSPDKRGISVVM